ncbi:hypothetical protein [Nostoc sp.]
MRGRGSCNRGGQRERQAPPYALARPTDTHRKRNCCGNAAVTLTVGPVGRPRLPLAAQESTVISHQLLAVAIAVVAV